LSLREMKYNANRSGLKMWRPMFGMWQSGWLV